jgi:antitoxin component YwqK of YwqJK toxin-antitoxin module
VYWENGQLMSKGRFKNGKQEGSWIMYWENGQLMYKGDYKNSKQEGSWVFYNEEGTLMFPESGVYKNDVKISD